MNRRPSVRTATRTTPRTTTRAAGLLAALVLGPLGLSACGGDADAAPDTSDPEASLAQVQEESGVPDECKEAFPVAVGQADAADVTLMPATWPADAVDGTLCQTSATGSGIQVASYATDLDGADVLDAVQAALPDSYEVTRADQGMGDQLDGSGDGVSFRVTTRPGAYELTFSEE